MARIRTIKPEFFDDPEVGELSPFARLFFIGLWTQADREGRLVADMRRLKARIFPYDDVDIEELAGELLAKDMVRRYQDRAGTNLFWVRTFTKHQRPHLKEAQSVIEPYPESREKVVASREKVGASTPDTGYLILDTGVQERRLSASVLPEPEPATSTAALPSEIDRIKARAEEIERKKKNRWT